MFDCSSRLQSPICCGFLIFHKPTNLKPLASTSPLHFNSIQPSFHLHLNHRFFLRCLPSSSPARNSGNPLSSTEYLLSSLDLSPKLAGVVRKREHKNVELKFPSNADAVLALFRDYGFSDTHMANIFSQYPELLSYDPNTTLKPKLDFFAQNGFSGGPLVAVVTKDPELLRRNLPRTIVPCFDFLRAFFGRGGNQAIASHFSLPRGTMILRHFSAPTAANVEALRSLGVPDANIVKVFHLRPQILCRDTADFLRLSREVSEMGYDPKSRMFVHGLCVFFRLKKEKWVSKMEVLRGFGWTDEQALAMFVKQPCFMTLSQKRLEEGLDLFINKAGWTVHEISKYPNLMNFSFEHRILPRLRVLEILISKGLREKSCIGHAFQAPEDAFLRRFVERYEQEIPELLELYQQNITNCKNLDDS